MYDDKRLIIEISTSENASCIVILKHFLLKSINMEIIKMS